MGGVDTLQLALAVETDTAQRRRAYRHVHLTEAPVLLTTTFIAGEPVGVLAVAAKRAGEAGHHLWVVPEPRNPDIRDDRIGPFLAWLGEQAQREADRGSALQVIVPSPAEVDDLAVLGRLYRYQRRDRSPLPAEVIAGAMHLSWLCGRIDVPGSALMLAATREVGRIWVPPLSAVECAHLGALVAAVDPPAGMGAQAAAVLAEATPFGPAHDNDELFPAVAAFNRARARQVEPAVVDGLSAGVERVAAGFVEPKLDALEHAHALLAGEPETPSAATRWYGNPAAAGRAAWNWGLAADVPAFTRWAGKVAAGTARLAIRPPRSVQAGLVSEWEAMAQLAAAREVYEDPLAFAGLVSDGHAWKGRVDWHGASPAGRPALTVTHPRIPCPFAPDMTVRWAGDPDRVGMAVRTVTPLRSGGSTVGFEAANPDVWRDHLLRNGCPAELAVADVDPTLYPSPPGVDSTVWT